jgi:hypothetical protein
MLPSLGEQGIHRASSVWPQPEPEPGVSGRRLMQGSDFDAAYAYMHFGGFLDLALPRGASRFTMLCNRTRIQCRRMCDIL